MPEEKKSLLSYERTNCYEGASDEKKKLYFDYAEVYKEFLNQCKTERESVRFFEKKAREKGFIPIEEATGKPGEKVFAKNGEKNIALAVIGKDGTKEGFRLVAGHVDCPRLDLKVLPLVEQEGFALLKTHYYGGIKKYQWLNLPLAMHGVVMKNDGTKVDILIGEDESDPVFTIPDLLPHLARKVQGEKKIFEAIEGENLNLLAASVPFEGEGVKEPVKETVLAILNEKYDLSEEDFISAEIEIVPAQKSKDVGLDRSMIGSYGHDDRVCSYNGVNALFNLQETPRHTAIALCVDKEEIGSAGMTGMPARFFPGFVEALLELETEGSPKSSDFRKCYAGSYSISADVSALVNPMFPQVHDPKNAARINCGVILEKYTGARGKYSGSDAAAETMGFFRKVFTDAGVTWQPGSLGKVDEGGGGTIAHEIAELGIQTVDCGTGVIGMHAPFEIVSKADVYETFLAYKAFFKA